MSKNFTGGCACGAIRYDVGAEPVEMADCQCRHCQQRSGTGHGSYLTFVSRASVKVAGKASEWDITGDGGTVKRHAFCPTCGSPVYLTIPAAPDVFIVHAASLDEPARYEPQHVMFTASAQAWDRIDTQVPRFEKMPPRAGGSEG